MNEKKFRMKVVSRACKARSVRVRESGSSVGRTTVVMAGDGGRQTAGSREPGEGVGVPILQGTGGSRVGVMSQAAVTEALRALSELVSDTKEIRLGRYGDGATVGVHYRFWLDPGINAEDAIELTVEVSGERRVHELFVLEEMWDVSLTNAEMLELCVLNCDSYDLLREDCGLRSMVSDGEYLDMWFDADAWGVYASVTLSGAGPSDIETTAEAETGADFWATAVGRGPRIEGCRKEGVLYIDRGGWKLYCWNASEGEYEPLGVGDEVLEEALSGKADASAVAALSEALSGKAEASELAAVSMAAALNAGSIRSLQSQLDGVNGILDGVGTRLGTTEGAVNGIDGRVGVLEGNFTGGKAKKAVSDEDGVNIKTNYLKKSEATFVRYDDVQTLSSGQKGTARQNIDSENLVCGYYAKGFTTNIYFTQMDGGSPTRSGVVNVYRDHHNLLWSIEYPSGTTAEDVIALVATYINNVAGYSATYDLNPPTQAYHAIITITGTSEAIEDIQFQSGFTGYVFTLEVEGAAAGFYSDANFEHLLTNSYVARKLYLDLGHNTLYCGNENELQPVTGSPIVNATYDSATGNVTLWLSAETSLTIPLAGIIPTYTAGKGISINGNTIAQNYRVVSRSEMEEYLATGVDDGLIRYVYEDEDE
ncbi:MAG: hypothetical protein J6T94_05530 [Bacteroidaceae bacterium]|nr:hypothetical protein [Bacteroidaceae bacterium]